MEPKGIIFDVDGTLIDSNDQHVDAWQRAFEGVGYQVPRERIADEVGKGGDKLVPAILGQFHEQQIGDEIRRRYTEEFRRLIEAQSVKLLPGAIDLLDSLRDRGLRTILATSSKWEIFAALEKSCGVQLSKNVDALVTADDADDTKPAPDLVQAACERLGLAPCECLMVGDTPYDAQASRKAGVPCIGLLSGRQHSPQALEDAGIQSLYRDPADILHHLDQALNIPPC